MSETTMISRYRVKGMDCASCGTKIETAVGRLPGVREAGVSVTNGSLRVTHLESASIAALIDQVRQLGYEISGPLPTRTAAGSEAATDEGRLDESPSLQDHSHDGHSHGGDLISGKQPGGSGHDHFELGDGPWWRTRKAALTAVSAVSLATAFVTGLLFPAIGPVAFLVALLVGLIPIGRRAVVAAMAGTPFSIETLMSIAAVGAVVIGATEEAATVVLLFLVGELLEGVAAGRARASIRGLASLVPKIARVEEAGRIHEVEATTLQVGMTIIARPGDRIAADGTILDGSAAIDESPVTGESVPRAKTLGDQVFAGTINTDAVLRIEVTATSDDNTISRVIRLVEEAQESKAPTQRFIDRFSTYYTPGVLVVGALVAVLPPLLFGQSWSDWVYKGLALLLIGCPCALVISTPAAIAAGLSAGARRGLLVKGGAVLERLRTIDTVALDKTGTLTVGKPKVTDVVALARSSTNVLSLAASIETGSSHPLATAIVNKAKAAEIPIPPSFKARAVAGKGVSGIVQGEEVLLLSPQAAEEQFGTTEEIRASILSLNDDGKTVSVLVASGEIAGLIAMRDEPREDAQAGLLALEASGVMTVMLTGDNERTARAIGATLGMDDVRASLLPEEKQDVVRELQRNGRHVGKVGDGINDAPALAAADIGIAMGGGTDVALETADAAVLHGRVADIANMIALSKSTMGNIWQNIALSLGLKAVFLVTTIFGITGLWPAILADTGATVLVTANAMRLLAWRAPFGSSK